MYEDFWSQTKQQGECLIWTGAVNQDPIYGIYSLCGGRLIAHRRAYELAIGPLPSHSHVGRTCNNALCVAPKHLFLQNSIKELDIKRKITAQINQGSCWLWNGKAPKSIPTATGIKTLPRAIYEIYKETIPRGKEVIRSCSTDNCLNPEHLVLVDKASLGKSNSKLNLEQVQEIRKLAHTGNFGLIELSERFKTSRQTIYTIVYNLGWYDEDYVPPEKMPRHPRLCRKGHLLSEDNLIEGTRRCKACNELKEKKPKKTLEDRFWEKVYKNRDGCWDWTAYSHSGWGYLNIDRIPQLAHRIAWELINGKIPEGNKVKQKCNNTLCCNPEHLYLEEK